MSDPAPILPASGPNGIHAALPQEARGLSQLEQSSDGHFERGQNGVQRIAATADGKVEFVEFPSHTLAYVKSSLGYPAYYPMHPATVERPLRAVLMDLDGTSVRSEGFWVWIIQQTVAALTRRPGFEFEASDLPFVSGHSVSEHLHYSLEKYCPWRTVDEARAVYYEHTRREMAEILAGRGHADAFVPSPGLKEFLLELKGAGIKIGLVTSGLHEKAYPEILAAFRTMGLGRPEEFYDSIVTAGYPLDRGEAGTLGELCAKPHPWLYAEVARVGLGIPFEERSRVVGIEDSSAGICAVRLAGYAAIGIAGGTIAAGGAYSLCEVYCDALPDAWEFIRSA